MSNGEPSGAGPNPFQNIFGDLARLLGSSSGALNWDVARQVTTLIASEGQPEFNVEPADRIKLEDLSHIALLHVEQVTGLSINLRGVEALQHTDWAIRTLDDYQDILNALADCLANQPSAEVDPLANDDDMASAMAFGDMQKFLSPVLLGIQVGGMIGHLSRRTLGQYDLPIPRRATDSLVLVPKNITEFADDWSLPRDELSLHVATEELVRLAVFQRTHVRERFTQLITEYVSGFRPDSETLTDQLQGLSLQDPSQVPEVLSNPEVLLGAIQTPEQQVTHAQLSALTAAFVGYVDWVVAQIAPKIIPTGSAIAEANKRRRVEETDGARLVERMLGLELSQQAFDRGDVFVSGVIERAGEDGIAKLWQSAHTLPTPAEVDAPGLWLARIELPSDN